MSTHYSVFRFKTWHLCLDFGMLSAMLSCYYFFSAYRFSSPISFIPYAAVVVAIWLFTIYAYGGYDYGRIFHFVHNLRLVFFSCLVAAGITQLFAFVYSSPYYVLGFHYTTVIFVLIFYFMRFAVTVFLIGCMPDKKLLIYGAGWAGQEILSCIREYPYMKYQPIAFIDDDVQKLDQIIDNVPVIGDYEKLYTAIAELDISIVVFAITKKRADCAMRAKSWLQEQDIEVAEMPEFYERLTERIPVLHVNNKWHDFYVSLKNRQPYVPFRIYNILLSTVLLLLFLPFFPLVALAIKLSSTGPIFYKQIRVGRKEKLFTMYKFRSMLINAEAAGVQWAQERDPRLTLVGSFLRKSRIDEIPQLVNVLLGDMNLVGPRPERPEFVVHLNKQIPFYRARHQIPPGLTGWAQVRMNYANSVEDSLRKLQYDLYYIKHRSLFLDFIVLSKTVLVVLARCGI